MKFVRLAAALSGAAVMLVAAAQFAPVRADVDVYFRAGLPGPERGVFRVNLGSPQPEYVVIPGSRVYAVRGADRDVYRYDNGYWAYDDGYWFRAGQVQGPWTAVRVERVPRSVLYVPAPYHTRWVTVPVRHRVARSAIRHEVREERREDRRERKAVKHHHNKEHGR